MISIFRGIALGTILGICGIYPNNWRFWVLLLSAVIFGGIKCHMK